MKELSIEQKAKAYDELKVKAQELTEDGYIDKLALLDLFPELKESNDERVRKILIEQMECWHECALEHNVVQDIKDSADAIAWLEKQGENPTTLPKWKYKKDNAPLLRDSLILNKYGCVAKSPSGALVSDVWVIDYDELAKLPKEEIEKQGEQKPVEWGEEDEGMLYGVIETEQYMLDVVNGIKKFDVGNCDIIKACSEELNWLKSLRDRVQLKQEWSEEDKKLWVHDDDIFLDAAKMIVEESPRKSYGGVHKKEIVPWFYSLKERLKSLRPQNTWKPSDEQMEAVRLAAEIGTANNSWAMGILKSMYQDLEKLKGLSYESKRTREDIYA